MADQLQQLLASGMLPSASLPPTSRYVGVGTGVFRHDGVDSAYYLRRFCPQPIDAPIAHRVVAGERLDTIAARLLGDAEFWWRIADANASMAPAQLEEPGTALRIGGIDG